MAGVVIACVAGLCYFDRILDFVLHPQGDDYVFLRSEKVNMRLGPHMDYPCKYTYTKKHLPMKVLREYEDWMCLQDFQGEQGWVHRRLCSRRKRYVITLKDVSVYKSNNERSKVLAFVDQGVCVELKRQKAEWCRVCLVDKKRKVRGWLMAQNVWGGSA